MYSEYPSKFINCFSSAKTTYLCINIIPIIAPNKIPKEEKIVEIPKAETKKETYIGFLVYLKIPVVITFVGLIKGAGVSSLE